MWNERPKGLARTGYDTHARRNPNLKKNQVKITIENTNKKHEDYERWHGQSRERNKVKGMSMSKVISNNCGIYFLETTFYRHAKSRKGYSLNIG